MMNKRFLHPVTLFFLLTLSVAVLSWVGDIYGWTGLRSLLSAEGLRWTLRTVAGNFTETPFLGNLLMVFFGVGLWMHSGLGSLWKRILSGGRQPSRKERRSLAYSLSVGAFCGVCCCLLAWGPWDVVRSIRGTLVNSPFMDGLGYMISVSSGLMAIVYAYAMDYYRSDRDIVDGMSYGFVRLREYFVILFFVSQFFACLHYTGLDGWIGITEQVYNRSFALCCIAPLFYAFRTRRS